MESGLGMSDKNFLAMISAAIYTFFSSKKTPYTTSIAVLNTIVSFGVFQGAHEVNHVRLRI